jgi:hypothetical protein
MQRSGASTFERRVPKANDCSLQQRGIVAKNATFHAFCQNESRLMGFVE